MAYETRLRGNNPKFIDIMAQGSADSSGAIARIPMRDGFFRKQMEEATLMAAACELREALLGLLFVVRENHCENSGPAQDAAVEALRKATWKP